MHASANPAHLQALLVDDEPHTTANIAQVLAQRGIVVQAATNVPSAKSILAQMHSDPAATCLVLTDLNHPPNRLAGVELITWIREHSCVAKMRCSLYDIPIMVVTARRFTSGPPEELAAASVPVFSKFQSMSSFDRALTRMLSEYRHRLRKRLGRMGFAIVWRSGRYAVEPLGSDPTEPKGSSFANQYSSLLFFQHHNISARNAIDELEELVNKSGTSERSLQRFFERHPEFLLREEYVDYWSEPTLALADGRRWRPDFVLRSRSLSSLHASALVELKRADVPLLTRGAGHPDLSYHVRAAINQLQDYAAAFTSDESRRLLEGRLGPLGRFPELIAVVGRSSQEHEKIAQLRTRVGLVRLVTYDHLLDLRKFRVEWLDAQRDM